VYQGVSASILELADNVDTCYHQIHILFSYYTWEICLHLNAYICLVSLCKGCHTNLTKILEPIDVESMYKVEEASHHNAGGADIYSNVSDFYVPIETAN